MHLALTWLREEDGPIADIAYRLGYRSEAAFNRAFRRVIGASPGAARKNGVMGNAQDGRRPHARAAPTAPDVIAERRDAGAHWIQ